MTHPQNPDMALPKERGQVAPLFGTDPHPHEQSGPSPIWNDLVRAHVWAGVILLLGSVVFGLITAYKFSNPDFLGQTPYLTWGRTRYVHLQGVLYGWLMNAFFAFLYYVIPRMREQPLLSRRLGWALFWLWNVGVVGLGWTLMLLGFSQALEWNEFPVVVDVIALITLLGLGAQFLAPYFRPPRNALYISSWYLILAILFTPLSYAMGAFLPYYLFPGAQGAAISGLWIHDAVGVVVTPLALAIAYYVIPAATGRPVYSHFLSMVGFWSLVFFYPMNGTHHYVFSPLPMSAQQAAIVASAFMGMSVVVVVTNLLLSLRGQARLVLQDLPLRWVWTGVIIYLIVSLQGSFQAAMPVQEQLHFSDWVVGHSHLAMAGFATFMAVGGVAHLWKRVAGYLPNPVLLDWAYWVSLAGLLLMVIDLTALGLVQAGMWMNGAPWIDTVVASRIGWWTRTLSGTILTAGFVLVLLSLRRSRRAAEQEGETRPAAAPGPVPAVGGADD